MTQSTELRIITSIEELTMHARSNNGIVDRTVDLSRQNISSLPEEVKEIRGSLFCHDCPQLVSLGNLQSVDGWLNCHDCPQLVSLGNLQSVGLWLSCFNCPRLMSLGSLQTVGGGLDCYNCLQLTSLGHLKSVRSRIDCTNSPLVNDKQSLLRVAEDTIILKRDTQNRLHCQDGCATISSAHEPEFYWHGVKVPSFVILHPESISLSYHINFERNAEVRRVMILRYGLDRYLKDAGGTLIDYDPSYGKLWQIIVGDRPVFMLEVINSSPEADGTFKHYFLSVPPTCSGNPALPKDSPMDSSYKAVWSLHRIIWGLGIPYKPSIET